MPKMKTHSGAKDRFSVTKGGKIRKGKLQRLRARRKSGAAFASTPIRAGRKYRRQHSGTAEVATADTSRIRRMLGI